MEQVKVQMPMDPAVLRSEIEGLLNAEDYTKAQGLVEALLLQHPDNIPLLELMVRALKSQGKFAQVVQYGDRLLKLKPDYATPGILLMIASSLFAEGDLKRSMLYYFKLLQHCDTLPPSKETEEARSEMIFSIGVGYDSLGDFEKAQRYYEMAIKMRPDYIDAIFVNEMLQIKCTNLQHDVQHYNTRFMLAGYKHDQVYSCPVWNREPLEGKRLLVWSEQGIGDIAMFAGFVPYLLQHLKSLTIEMTPTLVNLFARSFPEAEVVEKNLYNPCEAVLREDYYDYHTSIGELIKLLHLYKPRAVRGYIKPDVARRDELRARYKKDDRLLVGISWRTIQPETRFRRNIPLELWEPILHTPNVQFVSLQYSGEHDELAYVKKALGVDILLDETIKPMENREDFFAQVAAMDAVVSIQNSTVHAGGSVGVPTAIMLSRTGDFRWGVSGDESVWYESVKIFRQPEYGNWYPTIHETAKWLEGLARR